MNIKKIEIDIVERNLEFVGNNVYQSSGVTGGIVHQGILRIFSENFGDLRSILRNFDEL